MYTVSIWAMPKGGILLSGVRILILTRLAIQINADLFEIFKAVLHNCFKASYLIERETLKILITGTCSVNILVGEQTA